MAKPWIKIAHTAVAPAIPTFKGTGAKATFIGTNSVAVPYPTAGAAPADNDICLMMIESNNDGVFIKTDNGGAWTLVGTQVDATGTSLTVYWSRFGTGDTAPIIDAGGNTIDHGLAAIAVFSGCISSGDPWNVMNSGADNVSDTSFTGSGNTTTVNDCLVVVMTTLQRDSAADTQWSGWTNASLSDFTEIVDYGTDSGLGGSIGAAAGRKTSSGSYGNTTATRAVASASAYMTMALKPA